MVSVSHFSVLIGFSFSYNGYGFNVFVWLWKIGGVNKVVLGSSILHSSTPPTYPGDALV